MTINYRILIGEQIKSPQNKEIRQIIDEAFAEINAIYNKWNPDSELSRLNRLSADQTQILSPQLYAFLERTNALVQLTNGLFDPTVEPLQELWKSKLENKQMPSRKEIESLKPCLGWDKIHFENGIFSKNDSRTQLDLGGIAKGLCVDLLLERLNQGGYMNLYVEWGGEIRTSGHHPEGRPWAIYISHLEDSNPDNAVAKLDLINQAIATSGDYFQHWTVKDAEGQTRTYCHIFHPKKLEPVLVHPGSVASASILADDCMTADALAKVLMLFDSAEEAKVWFEGVQKANPEMQCWIVTR